MVYVFLIDGFEPIEAIVPVDMLRRAGLEVTTIALGDDFLVKGSRDIPVQADDLFCNTDFSDAEILILPGGPGAPAMIRHKELCKLLKEFAAAGKPVAAICAAPSVLGKLGILDGCKATVYPGCGEGLRNIDFTGRFVERDGNIITAIGPAASFAFSSEIIELLCGKEVRESVCGDMQFNAN